MFSRVMYWTLFRYWESRVKNRGKLGDFIGEVRRKEADLQRVIWENDRDELVRRKDNERVMAVEALEAEVHRLNEVLDKQAKKVARADEVYCKAIRVLKENLKTSSLLSVKVQAAMDGLAELLGGVEGIERDSSTEIKQLIGGQNQISAGAG